MKKLVFKIEHHGNCLYIPYYDTKYYIFNNLDVVIFEKYHSYFSNENKDKTYKTKISDEEFKNIEELAEKTIKTDKEVLALDGETWGFKYYKNNKLYWKRNLSHIYGITALEKITQILISLKRETILKERLELYIPKIEDYWYEQEILSDLNTMKYNAGYDVSYEGYDYNTGCINFPKEKWEETYNKRIEENRFFAYLKVIPSDYYIGYCNYQYNKETNRYECGIVIEYNYRRRGFAKEGLKLLINHAKENGIEELYNTFELDRTDALELFKSLGFKIVEETNINKFNKKVKAVIIKLEL